MALSDMPDDVLLPDEWRSDRLPRGLCIWLMVTVSIGLWAAIIWAL